MRIFVTGATGLVGSALVAALLERGDRVTVLSRRPADARARLERLARGGPGRAFEVVAGDPGAAGDWQRAVEGCDAVVHLAGEPVMGQRWSAAHKQAVRDSRVRSTEHVVEAIERARARAQVLVSGSAVGYYGARGDEELDETSGPGGDFLAQVCIDWEAAALRAESLGTRVVLLRTGIVLSATGGALERMLAPFRAFVGGPIGDGRQWWPWIHLADEVGLLLLALDDARVRGPLVGAAPNPLTMAAFSRALGRALHRPSWLPVPGLGLRLLFGEGAEVLLGGQRALPRRALELGYRFRFTDADAALRDLLGASGTRAA